MKIQFILLCLFVALCALPAQGFPDNRSCNETRESKDLEDVAAEMPTTEKKGQGSQVFSMRINAHSFDLGEPILVDFYLRNDSDEDASFIGIIHSDNASRTSLRIIRDDDGSEIKHKDVKQKYLDTRDEFAVGYMKYRLPPGGEAEIYHSRKSLEQCYDLDRPGVYTLNASFTLHGETFEAKPIKFTISDEVYKSRCTVGDDVRSIERHRRLHLRENLNSTSAIFRPVYRGKNGAEFSIIIRNKAYGDRDFYMYDGEDYRKNMLRLHVTGPDGEEATRTELGERIFPKNHEIDVNDISSYSRDNFSFIHVKQGDYQMAIPLGKYFDLSKKGKYKIKGELHSLIPGHRFVPPLESGELEFEISEGPAPPRQRQP